MSTISALGVGSGMDLNGLLEQLESAERQRLEPLAQQRQEQQGKISAFGKLEGALSSFESAATKLNDPDLYTNVASDVRGDAVSAAADSDAPPGNYAIDVAELARPSSVATEGVADLEEELGAGTLNFTLGNGDQVAVEVDEENSSLTAIRDAINSQTDQVQAAIVNDGHENPHRLVFTATETGTDAGITEVDFGDLSGALSVDESTAVEARNASLTVNGITVTSQQNRVEDAVQGVTLDLNETGTANLSIAQDEAGTTEAIQEFVSSYNSLQGVIGELTVFDQESGEAGELLGDSTLRMVESRLRSALTGATGDGDFNMLAQTGISLQRDGTLQIDDAQLSELTSGNMAELADFFTGDSSSTGFAGQLGQSLDELLSDNGPIATATSGLEGRMDRLEQQFDRMEVNIDRTITRYREQFMQLDSMVAEMQSTGDYLSNQFQSLNAQLGQ